MTLEELAEKVPQVKNVLWWKDRSPCLVGSITEAEFLLEDALIALQACACELERLKYGQTDD